MSIVDTHSTFEVALEIGQIERILAGGAGIHRALCGCRCHWMGKSLSRCAFIGMLECRRLIFCSVLLDGQRRLSRQRRLYVPLHPLFVSFLILKSIHVQAASTSLAWRSRLRRITCTTSVCIHLTAPPPPDHADITFSSLEDCLRPARLGEPNATRYIQKSAVRTRRS